MKVMWVIVVMLSILLVSCATSKLWDATDPDEFIALSMDEVTEQDLQQKGLEYEIDEERNMYYVEKNILQKSRDYIYRSFGTPVTVVVDVTTTVVVAGAITYAVLYSESTSEISFRELRDFLQDTPSNEEPPVYREEVYSYPP